MKHQIIETSTGKVILETTDFSKAFKALDETSQIIVDVEEDEFEMKTELGKFEFVQNDEMGREVFKATGTQAGDKITITKYEYRESVIKELHTETFEIEVNGKRYNHAIETFNSFIKTLNEKIIELNLKLWSY